MAEYTENLNLKQPGAGEDALIEDINNNMDLIDAFAGELSEKTANFVSLGEFNASGSALATKVQDCIGKVTTNGKYTMFDGVAKASGANFVCGYVYPNKDYGGGIISSSLATYSWTLSSGTIAVDEQPQAKLKNLKIDKVYGTSSETAINVDTISEPNGYIVRIQTDGGYVTGTLPTSIISGNAMLIYGFSYVQSGSSYGVQVAMGFGSDTLAIRKRYYGDGSWGAWKAIYSDALVKNDVTGVAQTSDLNTIQNTSLLTYAANSQNAPTATNGGVVFTLTNANGSQRAQLARPNNQSYFAIRFNSGTWTEWKNIVTVDKLTPTLILESGYPLASSETSYNCDWSQYKILIITYCFYSNILMTNVVATSEFANTANGRFIYLASDQSVSIRKNGNNAIYISYSGSNQYVQVKVWGVL